MSRPSFLDLPAADSASADVLLLPLPFEATACYGKGTAQAPEAIGWASTHIELWDEELDFDFDSLCYHTAEPIEPPRGEPVDKYLDRVRQKAALLHRLPLAADAYPRLVIGVGGEHSLTPPLVAAAVTPHPSPTGRGVGHEERDYSNLTVLQIDAHADLRDQFEGTPHSHACAMRRLVEKGATVLAVGIRSADREEFRYGVESGRVRTFMAQKLAEDADTERQLLDRLAQVRGDVYLTIDVDGLDTALCPGTGTPYPGGLGWWQTLRYLRTLLYENRDHRLIGCDVVETVPQPGTQVNEFTAARLLTKIIAYHFADHG